MQQKQLILHFLPGLQKIKIFGTGKVGTGLTAIEFQLKYLKFTYS